MSNKIFTEDTRISPLAILLCVGTAFFFGFSIALAKLAYAYGMSPLTFAADRAFFSVIMSFIVIRIMGDDWRLPKIVRGEVLPISIIMLMIAFGYPLAMKYVPASMASFIFYTFPLIVLAIGSFQIRRFPGIRRLVIFSMAFMGLALILGPSLDVLRWEGVAAGLMAALGTALFLLKIPHITQHTSGMTMNIYTNGINVVVLLVAAWFLDMFDFPTEPMGWLLIVGVGVLYSIGLVMLIYAVKMTNPVIASVFFNLEPLMVAGCAAYLFAEEFDTIQYVGMVVVVLSLMLANMRAAQTSPDI